MTGCQMTPKPNWIGEKQTKRSAFDQINESSGKICLLAQVFRSMSRMVRSVEMHINQTFLYLVKKLTESNRLLLSLAHRVIARSYSFSFSDFL